MKRKTIFLILILCFLIISCSKNYKLSGKYLCTEKGSKSYLIFLSGNHIKYRDNQHFHTLYIFDYKIHGNKIYLSNEYGDFELKIIDENTIQGNISTGSKKYKLVYKKVKEV